MWRHRTSPRDARCRNRSSSQDGIALLIVIAALSLVLGLSTALVLTAIVETRIAAASEDDLLALSAADSAAVRALVDLRAADWSAALAGTASFFSDGPASGLRLLPDGTLMDLAFETADMRCGRSGGCTSADIETPDEERPWGGQNPRWQLVAHGPASLLFPGDPSPPAVYVVVWVADDPTETDGDALQDGVAADDPGRGLLMVAARAYAARGTRRTVELVIERAGADLRILSRHERHP